MATRRKRHRPAPVAITVRRAQPGDLPAVNMIEQASFSDPWSPTAFREALASEYLYFSVGVDPAGAVVGYVVGWFAAGEGEIANIAVADEARGLGIGGRLLDEALASARASGAEAVHLEVRESNAAGRALYASRQFEPVGRRRNYYRAPLEDAIVLRRTLGDATEGPPDGGMREEQSGSWP